MSSGQAAARAAVPARRRRKGSESPNPPRRASARLTSMMKAPASTPGTNPARKSRAMEAPVTAPKRIIGMDGGMRIAMVADAESTAAAKGAG